MKLAIVWSVLLFTIMCNGQDLGHLVAQIDAMKEEIQTLKECQISVDLGSDQDQLPVGFIYIQLPSQKSPDQLWPGLKWQDVSQQYAGLFFRTVGGMSDAFGEVQDENCPRIDKVIHKNVYGRTDGHDSRMKGMPDDYLQLDKPVSEILFTGWEYDAKIIGSEGIQIEKYIGEFRPRNTAVKIWIRSA